MTTKRQTNSFAEQQQQFNVHIEGRVGKLEEGVKNLTNIVTDIHGELKSLAHGMTSFKDNISSHIGLATAPKWLLIAAISTLILTIVVQYVSNQNNAFTKIDAKISSIDSSNMRNSYEDGRHDMWREQAQKSISEMDVKLQREMTLINNTTESKITSAVSKLEQQLESQRSMATNHKREIDEIITDIKKWRLVHTETTAIQHSEILSQISALISKQTTIDNSQSKMEERQFDIARLVAQLDYLRPYANQNGIFKYKPGCVDEQNKLK